MNRARVSIVSDGGTLFSWIEKDEHWEEGEFEKRFQTCDFGRTDIWDSSSPIYGVLESLGQADECPPFIYVEPLVSARIEWLGDDPMNVGLPTAGGL